MHRLKIQATAQSSAKKNSEISVALLPDFSQSTEHQSDERKRRRRKRGKRVSRKSSYGKQSNSFVYLASCANMDLAYAVPVRHQKKNSKQSFNKFIFYDRSRFFLNRSILRGGQKFNISPVFMADRYNTFFLVM